MDLKQSFTILIAEDDYALGLLVEKTLRRAGFITTRARNGGETLRFCRERSPGDTLLLLDYNLGDMTAEEVLHQLKEEDRHFPFLIMTGCGSEAVAVEMMKLGAEDYIIKNDQALELLVCTLTGVLERKHTEQTLARTQQALATAYQAITAADNGIVIARMNSGSHRILYSNPAFEAITGYHCSAASTLNDWLDACQPQGQTELGTLRKALETQRPIHLTLRRQIDHAPRWHDVNLSFFQNRQQETISIGILTDTTPIHLSDLEIGHLRDQLEQTQRLAIAGQIARELAHEVGHPLTLISSKIQSMIAAASPETESLSMLLEHIDRMANLLRRFSSDSMDELCPARVSVGSIVESALHLCPVHNGITVSCESTSAMPLLYVDKAKITQVLLNLLVNALEACGASGRVVCSAAVVTPPETTTPYAAISVRDSGGGIAPEHRSKIFEAFFSTKSTSRSRGLGLPICQTIAHQHHGWIDVDSDPGRGTRFTLMLPLENDVKSNH